MIMMEIFIPFLFWINVISFWAYAMDKHYAYYNLWRIPERILIGLAIIGGAYGAGMAMILFRHKTRHRLFTTVVPIAFILWSIIGGIMWFYC